MNIDVDHVNHQYSGDQTIIYQNNSPDTLFEVFYHLYYNAFQPGSMMDLRAQNIIDPDRRIRDRISKLKKDEIGYHEITALNQDGEKLEYEIHETLMRVRLKNALPPENKTTLEMKWKSQIPLQIRRTGRNNIEGIDYSMSQWYPKLAEYDAEGWHAFPYVAREYHGVWGDFDINISIDSSYTIGATGVLQNADHIGKGYGTKTIKSADRKLTWHFVAKNVIDFVWAADPDYIHTKHTNPAGVEFHFFYQNDTSIIKNWEVLPKYTIQCFDLMKEMFGEYPYPTYSVIQGGDGGMEYPMATLILGNGSQRGLIGVMVHEGLHSWFQAVLATNESKYAWMDEGFNTYYNHLIIDSLYKMNLKYPHKGSYDSYFRILDKGNYEALSTRADHFNTNKAYGVAAYSMGCIFLNQLNYIVGEEVFDDIMSTYWNEWKFKHPNPNDFKKIAEQKSGMHLDWYFNYFIHSTKKIDYEIVDIAESKKSCKVELKRLGQFPMPIDVEVELLDNRKFHYTIPLQMMMKGKSADRNMKYEILDSWSWTNPNYILTLPFSLKRIKSVKIDPTRRMADVDQSNNTYPKKSKD